MRSVPASLAFLVGRVSGCVSVAPNPNSHQANPKYQWRGRQAAYASCRKWSHESDGRLFPLFSFPFFSPAAGGGGIIVVGVYVVAPPAVVVVPSSSGVNDAVKVLLLALQQPPPSLFYTSHTAKQQLFHPPVKKKQFPRTTRQKPCVTGGNAMKPSTHFR